MTTPATYQTLMPVCPHCGHEFDADDMNDPDVSDDDLWAAAPDERMFQVRCPDASCDKDFWLKGGYRPQYTTAINENDL